jgi:hypothetical protein
VIVASAVALTVTVFDADALQPLVFVTVAFSVTLVPVEVKVMAFVPAPELMLPPVIVHA